MAPPPLDDRGFESLYLKSSETGSKLPIVDVDVDVDVTVPDPMVGRVVDGRYLVKSRIARGGMATVYLALDHRLDRKVALKVMHEHLAVDEEFVARFVREARAAARLSHSNVVQVFDQGSDEAVLYLTMEYLPGRTLRDVLTGRGALTSRESISVLEPVLGALAAAHRAGIVHGDLKPENVILTDDGRIKVADFGLARAISAASGTGPTGSSPTGELLLGTVAYLSPELVSRGIADARTDVYAAGILLFELLTGKQPFVGDNPLSVAQRHVHESVPTPTSLAPELPSAFDPVVLQATSHDPDQRPPNAGALLSDLKAAMGRVTDPQLDIRASDPPVAGPAAARPEIDDATGPDTTGREAIPTAPAAASRPQPTRVLTHPRRPVGGGTFRPRPKVREDEPEGPGFLGDRRRRSLAAAGAAAAVVLLLVVTGVWWFVGGPGSYVDTPYLVGQRASDAQRIATTLGLSSQVKLVFNAKVATGQVVSTHPAGGKHVTRNGTVLLTVSQGPQLIGVPDVAGLSVPDATTAIQKAQLKVGATTGQVSSSVDQGKIISTSPLGGTKIAPGRAVDLVVSQGAIIKGLESGRCVEVPPGVQDNQTRTTLDDCNGGTNQAWTAVPSGPSGQLTLYGGTKCLDVAGNSTDDGAAVQLFDCNGGANQQWSINPDGSIVGVGSGKCLDATDHGTVNATPLQIWSCGGGANQKWSRN